MKKRNKLGFIVIPFLALVSSCSSNPVAKIYTSGMNYYETAKSTPEEYASLTYDIMGGDEVMPIGGFYAPYATGGSVDGHTFPDFISEKYYQYIEDAGINMFVYSNDRWSYKGGDSSNAGLIKSLDLCEKHGIGYFVDSYWVRNQLGSQTSYVDVADMELSKEGGTGELQKLVDEISNSGKRKGFIGILGFDEPFPGQIDNLGVLQKAFYSLDNTSGYDVYMNSVGYWSGEKNFFGYSNNMTYDEYMEKFMKTVSPKMLSHTEYPYSSAQTSESDLTSLLFNELARYRNDANKYNLPFWRMLQAGGQWNDAGDWIDSVDPYPSEGELLFDVNISLAYGAKAIMYFPLIEPLYFAYKTGGTYDFERNGLIGADGNLTRWYYYAKRANTQIKAIDNVLMKCNSDGLIVHGDKPTKYIVTDGTPLDSVIESGAYRQLSKVSGDDCVIGCFDYKGGTALYAVNYSRTDKADITLSFDKDNYRYRVTQRGESSDFVGSEIPLRLDRGEGALIVLS